MGVKRMVVKKNGCQKCALIKQCCSKTVWLEQKSFVENLSKEKEETNCEMIMLIKTLWLRERKKCVQKMFVR